MPRSRRKALGHRRPGLDEQLPLAGLHRDREDAEATGHRLEQLDGLVLGVEGDQVGMLPEAGPPGQVDPPLLRVQVEGSPLLVDVTSLGEPRHAVGVGQVAQVGERTLGHVGGGAGVGVHLDQPDHGVARRTEVEAGHQHLAGIVADDRDHEPARHLPAGAPDAAGLVAGAPGPVAVDAGPAGPVGVDGVELAGPVAAGRASPPGRPARRRCACRSPSGRRRSCSRRRGGPC